MKSIKEEIKLARIEYSGGNYHKAQQILEATQENFNVTNNSVFSFTLARVYAAQNNKQAFEYFRDALEIAGDQSELAQDIYTQRAKFYFTLGKLAQAKKDYEKIDLEGDNVYNYAIILYEEDRQKYQEFLAKKIDNPELLADKLANYNKSAAIELYERLVEDVRIYKKLHQIYEDINEAKAKEYLEKFETVTKEYEEVSVKLEEFGWSKQQLSKISSSINQPFILSLRKILKLKISPDLKIDTKTALQIILGSRHLDESIEEIKKAKEKSLSDLKEELSELNPGINLDSVFLRLEQVKKIYNQDSNSFRIGKSINQWIQQDISKWSAKAKSPISMITLEETLAVIQRAVFLHEGYEPRDTQILSVLSILESKNGRLADIKTGEGKSVTTSMLAIVKAIKHGQVDLVTSSEVLAKRDAEEKEGLYKIFGLSSGHNFVPKVQDLEVALAQKQSVYQKDIVYGTVSQFQFDMLQDVRTSGFFGNRSNKVVIVDEVDSMLIDGKNSQARLSQPTPGMLTFNQVLDYIWIFAQDKSSLSLKDLTQACNSYIDDLLQGGKISLSTNEKVYMHNHLNSWIQSAFIVINYKVENQDYIIQEGKVKIVDFRNTGVIQDNTQWNEGIHYFLQLKHGLDTSPLNLVTEYMSNVSFFQKYGQNIYGLTGTIGSEAEQLFLNKLYGVDFVFIPTHKYGKFVRNKDALARDESNWLDQIAGHAEQIVDANRSLLVISESIQKAGKIHDSLVIKGLNAKLYTKEDEFDPSSEVLQTNQVIVATNLAGRGTDIKTSYQLELNGGMDVLVTFLPSNLRVEAQAFGRTARKGNQGSGNLVINLEDLEHPNLKLMAILQGIRSVQQIRNLVEEENVKSYDEEVRKILKKDQLYSEFSNLFLKGKNSRDSALSEILYKWGMFLDKVDYQYKEEEIDLEFKKLKQSLTSFKVQNPCIALPESIQMIINDKPIDAIKKIHAIDAVDSRIEPMIDFTEAIALNKISQFEDASKIARRAIEKIQINHGNDQLRTALIKSSSPSMAHTIEQDMLQVQNIILEPLKTLDKKSLEHKKVDVEIFSLSDAGISQEHANLLHENGYYILKVSAQVPWGQITGAFILNTGMVIGGAILAEFTGPIGSEIAKELIKTGAYGCVDIVMTVLSGQAEHFEFSNHLKQQTGALVVNVISNRALMSKAAKFSKSALDGKESWDSLGKQFIDSEKVMAFKNSAKEIGMTKQCLNIVKNASKVAIKEVGKQGISPILTFGVQKVFGPENQFEMYRRLVEEIEPELISKIKNERCVDAFVSFLILSDQTGETDNYITANTSKLYFTHFKGLNLDFNTYQTGRKVLELIANSQIKSYEHLKKAGAKFIALPVIIEESKHVMQRYTDFFIDLIKKQHKSADSIFSTKYFGEKFKLLLDKDISEMNKQDEVFTQKANLLQKQKANLESKIAQLNRDKSSIEENVKIINKRIENGDITQRQLDQEKQSIERQESSLQELHSSIIELQKSFQTKATQFNGEASEFSNRKSLFQNQMEKIKTVLEQLSNRLVQKDILFADKSTFNPSNLDSMDKVVNDFFNQKYPDCNILRSHIIDSLSRSAQELCPLHKQHKNHFCDKSVEEIEKNILKKYFDLVVSKIINQGVEYVNQKMQAAHFNITHSSKEQRSTNNDFPTFPRGSDGDNIPLVQPVRIGKSPTKSHEKISLLDNKLEDYFTNFASNFRDVNMNLSQLLSQSNHQETKLKNEILDMTNYMNHSNPSITPLDIENMESSMIMGAQLFDYPNQC